MWHSLIKILTIFLDLEIQQSKKLLEHSSDLDYTLSTDTRMCIHCPCTVLIFVVHFYMKTCFSLIIFWNTRVVTHNAMANHLWRLDFRTPWGHKKSLMAHLSVFLVFSYRKCDPSEQHAFKNEPPFGWLYGVDKTGVIQVGDPVYKVICWLKICILFFSYYVFGASCCTYWENN